MLPPVIVSELFNLVKGKSSLAQLHAADPIPFNGMTEFTFTLDKEADIVGENQPKSNGGMTMAPVTIRPVKFEYGARVSDEFMRGSAEYRLDVLRAFANGAAIKFARGLDIAGGKGLNPRTGTASAVVGDNNFSDKITNYVTYTAAAPDANIDAALATILDADATGIWMTPAMRSALAAMTVNGANKYPAFAFGARPADLGGMKLEVNSTLAVGNTVSAGIHAIVGDFASAFKWGYAAQIPLEVIEYGNPDNDAQAGDLKGHNQVYLRAEAYIGWGILAPSYFAKITI
jgi:hypothetical protein